MLAARDALGDAERVARSTRDPRAVPDAPRGPGRWGRDGVLVLRLGGRDARRSSRRCTLGASGSRLPRIEDGDLVAVAYEPGDPTAGNVVRRSRAGRRDDPRARDARSGRDARGRLRPVRAPDRVRGRVLRPLPPPHPPGRAADRDRLRPPGPPAGASRRELRPRRRRHRHRDRDDPLRARRRPAPTSQT